MEKVVAFKNSGTRNFWFRYIVKKIGNRNILFKAYLSRKEIWINGNRIMFRTLEEIDNPLFMRARDNAVFYNNMEHRLEYDFEETIEEILLDG